MITCIQHQWYFRYLHIPPFNSIKINGIITITLKYDIMHVPHGASERILFLDKQPRATQCNTQAEREEEEEDEARWRRRFM
jgi:hypothetical protein